MRSSLFLPIALVVLSCAPAIDFHPHSDQYEACGRHGGLAIAEDGGASVVGTIHQIVDSTPTDGPVLIVLIDPTGQPLKLYFRSLFTVPGPSAQTRETYKAIAASRVGDCVQVLGTQMPDGRLWVHRFSDLDRS